jgi:hypothetical protein
MLIQRHFSFAMCSQAQESCASQACRKRLASDQLPTAFGRYTAGCVCGGGDLWVWGQQQVIDEDWLADDANLLHILSCFVYLARVFESTAVKGMTLLPIMGRKPLHILLDAKVVWGILADAQAALEPAPPPASQQKQQQGLPPLPALPAGQVRPGRNRQGTGRRKRKLRRCPRN